MKHQLNNALLAELENPISQFRLELLCEINNVSVEEIDYWIDWHHKGNHYDVNIFSQESDLILQVYPTNACVKYTDTKTYETLAEISINLADYLAKTDNSELHSYNVQINLTIPLGFEVKCLSAREAIEKAIIDFRNSYEIHLSRSLDEIRSLKELNYSAHVTNEIPRIGNNCYKFNLLESLSKEVEVFASSPNEAEDHLKNHLTTHLKLGNDDSIGIDVLISD